MLKTIPFDINTKSRLKYNKLKNNDFLKDNGLFPALLSN